ncbi:Serine/threonine-protein phosphatase 7 long form-like protein [Senna tora]|uniref:Serine/threonine-protein phosphatase 7 long form-like protein n=1 Tax=Senna tora TaxID=362788 RepID=A0A834U087_9FABA|nr:Serine/threonine-protein phosphatase 7 long form-like protein [Senna tora]
MTEVVTAGPASPRPTLTHPTTHQWLRASVVVVILPRATVLLVTSRFAIICRLDENGDQWMRVAHLPGPGPRRITAIDRIVRECGRTGCLVISSALRVQMEVQGLHVPGDVRNLVFRQWLLVYSVRENTKRLALFQRKETTHYINKGNTEEFKMYSGNASLAEPLSSVRPPSGSIVGHTSGSREIDGSANARASCSSALGCVAGPSLPAAREITGDLPIQLTADVRLNILRDVVSAQLPRGSTIIAPPVASTKGGKSVPRPHKQKVGTPAHVLAVPPCRLAHLAKQVGQDRRTPAIMPCFLEIPQKGQTKKGHPVVGGVQHQKPTDEPYNVRPYHLAQLLIGHITPRALIEGEVLLQPRNLHPMNLNVWLRWSLPKQLLAEPGPVMARALYHRLPLNGEAQLDGHVLQSDRGLPDAHGHMERVCLWPPPHDQGCDQVQVVWEEAGSRRSVKAGCNEQGNKRRWRITVAGGPSTPWTNCCREGREDSPEKETEAEGTMTGGRMRVSE